MDELLTLCKTKYSAEEIERIKDAIAFASDVHSGQMRESGDPYITHPLVVAKILFEIGLDCNTVIAGLLHDVIEDGDGITYEIVEKRFGTAVATMVDGVTKLTQTNMRTIVSKEEAQAENLRKMFVAIAKEMRVVIIKLTDRLHNMRTLDSCPREKQIRKAKETLDVYAPLAHRFGMGAIKCELEDLCLKYLYPDDYNKLKTAIEPQQMQRMQLLETTMETIKRELHNIGIEAKINGRPKHLYSIYRKISKQNVNIDEIFDLTALRVIVNTQQECYAALCIIHNNWRPIPGRFKDYIATPKPNMYQSIHTTLLSEYGLPFEVQIRTAEMHKTAEYGIAAHWMYKEGREDQTKFDMRISWLRQALEMENDSGNAVDLVENIQKDFFSEYVFVVTPTGEIIDLPMGSTPLDFAYKIHTNVGHKAQHAKVNGSIVRLDYKLKTNDVVEIITGSHENPSRDWLNMVKTQQAKTKIRAWFKRQNREENIERGKSMLSEAAKRQNIKLSDLIKPEYFTDTLKHYNMPKIDDVYAAIGYGGLTSSQIFHALMKNYRDEVKDELATSVPDAPSLPPIRIRLANGVSVKGDPTMSTHFALCCSPLPGDSIFGYITRGRGVSVHREDCPNAHDLKSEPERIVEVEWLDEAAEKYTVHICVECAERVGMVNDIAQLFVTMNINLLTMVARQETNAEGRINLSFEIGSAKSLERVFRELRKVPSVTDVYRTAG
ncbi:MAG: bifunctional (p)ppGpp synthetase/guanosine-3',5'-bis(diphosphate) 3'-pyrophosphohydrolase [Clostridia bacterium]